MRFDEFMADDLATVAAIYELAGQPLDDAARGGHAPTSPPTSATATAPSATTSPSSASTPTTSATASRPTPSASSRPDPGPDALELVGFGASPVADVGSPAVGDERMHEMVSELFDPDGVATRSPGFDFTDITYHRAVDHGTVRIAFDRPEVRNAFRPAHRRRAVQRRSTTPA